MTAQSMFGGYLDPALPVAVSLVAAARADIEVDLDEMCEGVLIRDLIRALAALASNAFNRLPDGDDVLDVIGRGVASSTEAMRRGLDGSG